MSLARAVNDLHRALIQHLELSGETGLNEARLSTLADQLIREQPLGMPVTEVENLIKSVVHRMIGWGPLTPLLQDASVTEIMVNGTHSLYVERGGKLESLPNEFFDDEEILQVINRMVSQVGRRIDAASPLVDARLPDGSRINAIIAPLSLSGPVLTIRRFPEKPLSLDDLIRQETLSRNMADFLRAAIEARLNIVISGGAGSGKTTTLNALASCIPSTERLITIEDAAEMRITHPHLVALESRPPNIEGKGEIPLRLLLKNALRMRPDRILVGEIRGAEALDMLQAMNTGHRGSLTTVHANAPLESLLRIETMTLMADVELPLAAVREQVRQAIHLVLQQERLKDGRRKIVAIHALNNDRDPSVETYKLEPLFIYDKTERAFQAQGTLPPAQKKLFEER
ncbi:MAG: CpaF family protein [Candidatus Uhrbacteria bacterium]|nr:CpaF family protein [Candidatus Uhrbacteria bacterium]MDP3793209.1 CpaF family protein [Candidatus Uhrbacteria bacterium]